MNDTKICCFTGHRSVPDDLARETRDVLEKAIRSLARHGVTSFRAGGARGFDCMAALAVLAVRDNEFPDIKLDLFLPCKDQTKNWKLWEKAQYAYILKKSDSHVYTSDKYYSGCMHKRNRAMVEGSDFCIAFYDGSPGGTAYTVDYAASRGLQIINIYDLIEKDEDTYDD